MNQLSPQDQERQAELLRAMYEREGARFQELTPSWVAKRWAREFTRQERLREAEASLTDLAAKLGGQDA